MEPLKWRNIHNLYTTDTSPIRTLCPVPSVSVLERFDCSLFYCISLFSVEHLCIGGLAQMVQKPALHAGGNGIVTRIFQENDFWPIAVFFLSFPFFL